MSANVEIKERLENWRKWVLSAYYPGGLSSQNIVQGILDNTAQAANYSPRVDPVNAQCEETDSWIQRLLNDEDTYYGGLAVKMQYESRRGTPTQYIARYFPETYAWAKFKNMGGSFEQFREEITKSQTFKRHNPHIKNEDYPAHLIKIGVKERVFAETELEGRNFLIGIIRSPGREIKVSTANVYNVSFARR